MRTLKEVIAILANGIADVEAYDAVDDALYYLREYHDNYGNLIASMNHHLRKIKELEQNDPLSWEELCEMEGEPIWVEKCQDDEPKGWLLILRTNADVVNCTTKHGNSFYLYRSLYGEKWQAYRKERANENLG